MVPEPRYRVSALLRLCPCLRGNEMDQKYMTQGSNFYGYGMDVCALFRKRIRSTRNADAALINYLSSLSMLYCIIAFIFVAVPYCICRSRIFFCFKTFLSWFECQDRSSSSSATFSLRLCSFFWVFSSIFSRCSASFLYQSLSFSSCRTFSLFAIDRSFSSSSSRRDLKSVWTFLICAR